MAGFDILNITGYVSKSKQKDPFSAVTERSVMSPTLANSTLGIRPGERVGNSKCREWWKAIFSPPPASGNGPSVPRELLSSPQPGSCCVHFMHLSIWCSLFFVYGQNQSPPLHDLRANISFTDQDLQQPQLGLNLLVFIVFFSHRSAVFFLHVPSGSESRSWGFL